MHICTTMGSYIASCAWSAGDVIVVVVLYMLPGCLLLAAFAPGALTPLTAFAVKQSNDWWMAWFVFLSAREFKFQAHLWRGFFSTKSPCAGIADMIEIGAEGHRQAGTRVVEEPRGGEGWLSGQI